MAVTAPHQPLAPGHSSDHGPGPACPAPGKEHPSCGGGGWDKPSWGSSKPFSALQSLQAQPRFPTLHKFRLWSSKSKPTVNVAPAFASLEGIDSRPGSFVLQSFPSLRPSRQEQRSGLLTQFVTNEHLMTKSVAPFWPKQTHQKKKTRLCCS